MSGSSTTHGYFWKPDYGEKGPAAYNSYNAALDATDVFLYGLEGLADFVTNWAIEDNIVTLVTATPTYSDNNTFTLPGDYTSRFPTSAVVQVQVAAGMVYSTVASSSYAAPTTTVNLNDTVLTDPITRVYVVATRDGLWPNGPGYIVAADYGTDQAALTSADAVASAAGKQLLIGRTYSITSDLTLEANIKVLPGSILTIATTKTLTINGTLDAGLYQIFSCTGTGAVVFGSGRQVQAAWWGIDGPAVQAAVTSLSAVTGRVLLTPNTSYTFTVTLTTYKGVELVGSNSILNFAALTTPDTAVSVDPNGTVSLQGMNPVARDVHFKGHATMAAGTYTADLTGFEFNTSNITFHHCLFTGFDKATDFDTNSFSVEFHHCTSRYNNYGFYFDATGETNIGEHIMWNGGGVTNNNYGIYNNLGELTFRNVGIDYNLEAHVSGNVTDVVGVASSILSFVDCHFENASTTSAEGKVRFTNAGRMVIRGGMIHDDVISMITNSGHLLLDSPVWRITETKYTVTNTGYFYPVNVFTHDATMNPRFCATASRVRNNGFETGDLTGWTIAPGTEAAADNTTAYEGTWSMKIAPTAVGTATWATSQKIVIPPGRQYANLTFWAKSAAAPTMSVFLMSYEIEGAIADWTPLQYAYTEVTVPPATAAWTRYRAQTYLPPNGGYVIIQVRMPADADTTHFANVDEFVVDFQ